MKDGGTGWGKVVVGAVGLIASLIGIFAFISGKESIPDILGQDRVTFVATSKPQVLDAPSTESPSSIQKPLVTPSQMTNTPILDGAPKNWMVDSNDIPAGMSLGSSEEASNEDIAKYYDNPSEMFNKLEVWERLDGYQVVYAADKYGTTCSSETGLITITMQVVLHQSEAGADGYFDYLVATEKIVGTYRQEEGFSVGDKTYSAWFEFTNECRATEGNNSNWIGYIISFRRYNVVADVYVDGVKGIISEGELESIAIRLARLIDLKLVAQAK